jgi:nicotinate-nucleotide pyrophosphorylase (carboxylating)
VTPSAGRPFAGLDALVRRALDEDDASHDITTLALIEPGMGGRGEFLVKAPGVIAGLPVAQAVFRVLDPTVRFTALAQDSQRIRRGQVVANVEGPLASLLSGERVALNFLQRLSGIATLTARYVAALRGTKAQVLDTRKTTPGLRLLEKYAVAAGGGRNHRMGMGDAVLIKDNHIAALRGRGLSLAEIVRRARERAPAGMPIEIEVTTVQEAHEAIAAGAGIILLDNMGVAAMRQAVRLARGKCKTEASGGMTLAKARQTARTGVDYISVGALTHSAKALDISLEIEAGGQRRSF